MKNKKIKLSFILALFASILVIIFVVLKFETKPDKKYEENISDSQAKAIQIENKKITNISNTTSKKEITTTIKNTSNNTISDINIEYNELDKNNNEIASNKYPVEVSLQKNEQALITILPKNYAYTVEIVGYSYMTKGYHIDVNLKKDSVNIRKVKKNSKDEDYDILEMSNLEKKDNNNYELVIKNSSKKILGNIILKVAEKNESGEYVKVNHVPYNSTLKQKEKTNLILSSSTKENSLEVVGYTYDDVESKSNIEVDLKTYSANVVKN